jgi:phage terminase large subunit-like protein
MSLLASLTSSEQRSAFLARLEKEQARRKAENKLAHYRPYPKQQLFHNASASHRERLFMAGNQLGKTFSGAAEAAIHLTGRYPDWWQGRRFDRPVRAWAGSETNEVTRDGVQRYLVGEPKNEQAWGTGIVPKACLKDWTRRQGVPNALDGIMVEHVSGGLSMLGFKSYDQGRTKWQGETLDFVWLDEEPDHDIYMEALTRTNATGGFIYLTFTPLKGMSAVVDSYIQECGLGE